MAWLTNLLMVLQVLTALGVIVLVLLQHGKGADMGAAFGGGASGSLFGATGSANFLSRSTAVLAALFFICTLALALLANRPAEVPRSIMENAPAPASTAAPKAPADVPPANGAAAPGANGGSQESAGGAQAPAPTAPAPKSGPGSDIPK